MAVSVGIRGISLSACLLSNMAKCIYKNASEYKHETINFGTRSFKRRKYPPRTPHTGRAGGAGFADSGGKGPFADAGGQGFGPYRDG